MQEEITLAIKVGRIERELELMKTDLNDFATKQDIDQVIQICRRLSRKIASHDQKFENLDQKVENLDQKVENLDQKVENLDQKVEDLDQKVEDLDQKVEDLDRKFEDLKLSITQGRDIIIDEIRKLGEKRKEN